MIGNDLFFDQTMPALIAFQADLRRDVEDEQTPKVTESA
jgi:hypothetical protein